MLRCDHNSGVILCVAIIAIFAGCMPTSDSSADIVALREQAELQMQQGHLTEAAATLRTILKHRNDDTSTRRMLARLLEGCGLNVEVVALLRQSLQHDDVDFTDLVSLACNGQRLRSRLALEQMNQQQQQQQQQQPHDPLPVLGLLKHAEQRRDLAAEQQLLASATSHPMLRTYFLRQQDRSAKDDVTKIQTLLTDTLQEPQPASAEWLLAASWCQRLSRPSLATRCLLQAVEGDHWNVEYLHALSESVKSDSPETADDLLTLWETLMQIKQLADHVFVTTDDVPSFRQLALLLRSIGRQPEAMHWARCALRVDPHTAWAREAIRNWADAESTNEWTHPTERLSPVLRTRPTAAALQAAEKAQVRVEHSASSMQFREVATSVGLDFVYNNGSEPGQRGLKMPQWTGGGVGVVDIDADSLPDLYLTQAGSLSGNNESDQLYRNILIRRFANVTGPANVNETGFGQGVAVSDVNNDGFDDIYVANVGHNRLLLNQGDGTFQRTSFASPSVWTTSVAIADLNSDGNADLYDTNYLQGQGVFERTCDHESQQRVCGPMDFAAEPDRVFLSGGDDSFTDASSLLAAEAVDARGMGVLVANIDGEGGNEIFVANDETANQLYRITGTSADDAALQSGLAFNQLGQQQGSMGIACGDVDGNGLADLLVTNYYSEANTLYSQLTSGIFVDGSVSANLSASSFAMLGFGCQFDDFDNDGDADLVVANGHLDDFTHLGHPWRMRPQLFANDGVGRFREVDFNTGYFATEQLGRSLATLDWNTDGRADFVVTTLDLPVQLQQNTTAPINNCLSLQLIGLSSSRTPVGAKIEFGEGVQKQNKWLTAGDGYQCSNGKPLRFVVKSSTEQIAMRVYWPGGRMQNFHLTASAGKFVAIEGRTNLQSIP